MDPVSRRDLQALEAICENESITQRRLSNKLGIALGLTNLYVKRLVRKGYIKCVSIRSNRIRYLVTPRGLVEKARLTYEFMDYSLELYGQVRRHLRQVLSSLAHGDRTRVAIYGSGEAAELAYMSIVELGLNLVAVFDAEPGTTFLGHPVLGIRDHYAKEYHVMVVATLDVPRPIIERLLQAGVPADKLVTFREDRGGTAGTPARRRSTPPGSSAGRGDVGVAGEGYES